MGRKPNEERTITVPREELEKYLVDNHRLFTMSEMASETGYTYSQIKVACENAGLQVISVGERTKEYVECNMHLTLQEQATKLDMSVDSLRYYYKQFGFDVRDAGRGKRIIPASRLIRSKANRIIRELGTIPLEMALGPIARKYNINLNPLDVINETRMRVITS